MDDRTDIAKPPLNESQRRVISITLASVERDLLWLRSELRGSPHGGVLARYSEPLPSAQWQCATDLITQLQEQIRTISHALDLSPQHEPQLRTALAALVLADVAVEEIGPRHLRSHGDVDPAATAFLNRELPPLKSLLRQLIKLLDSNGFVHHEHSSTTS